MEVCDLPSLLGFEKVKYSGHYRKIINWLNIYLSLELCIYQSSSRDFNTKGHQPLWLARLGLPNETKAHCTGEAFLRCWKNYANIRNCTISAASRTDAGVHAQGKLGENHYPRWKSNWRNAGLVMELVITRWYSHCGQCESLLPLSLILIKNSNEQRVSLLFFVSGSNPFKSCP